MKNKIAKTILAAFLCLIIFSGCSVVPSSTPDITLTPTPIEPTPTPIPYGEILDITIGYDSYFSDNALALDITNISKTLLERFSLRVIDYANADNLTSPDAVFYIMPPDISITSIPEENVIRAKAGKAGKEKYNSINYLEYIDKLPRYLSLFSSSESFLERFAYGEDISQKDYEYALPATGTVNTPTSFWIYNKEWFSKNGYNVPQSMDELISLLVTHKNTKESDSQPILSCNETGSMVTGLFASYGVDYRFATGICDVITENDGEYSFTMSDPAVIKALDSLKLIEDNSLAGDKYINYDDISKSNLSEYAVFYYSPTLTSSEYNVSKEINNNHEGWEVFENGLSADNTVYLQIYPYIMLNTYSNHEPGNFLIVDTGRKEVVDRLLDFVDWCCSDEGIIACNYGIEGKDFIFNNEGTIELLNEKNNIVPAALRTTLDAYTASVLRKYTGDNSSPIIKKAEAVFADKQAVYFNNIERILPMSEEVPNYGRDVMNIISAYVNDYVNGKKTADNFNDYLSDLENAGLSDFLNGAKDYYDELYEEFKDYLPDSLK